MEPHLQRATPLQYLLIGGSALVVGSVTATGTLVKHGAIGQDPTITPDTINRD